VWHHQPPLVSNWNLVFRTPEIDGCRLTAMARLIPAYESFIDSIKTYIPNIPLQCPIKPGPFEFRNISITEQTLDQNMKHQGIFEPFSFNLPNGKHRITLKFFNSADPIGIKVQWVTEIKRRLQIDKF
jgi:Protein of unknown function (DUF1091)